MKFGQLIEYNMRNICRIKSFLVQTPPGARLCLGTQPPYKGPNLGSWQVSGQNCYNAVIIRLGRLSFGNDPKLAVGQPNSI